MQTITSQVETTLGKQYLFKLCKHFARKIRVDFDTDYGIAYFQFGEQVLGSVELRADPQHIEFTIQASDAAALTHLKAVIEDHLQLMRRATNPELVWNEIKFAQST